jgi:DNA-binding response OmpR family regulator
MYSQFKTISILLAEDEKKLALAMKTAIGEYFHKFIVTHDGEEALKAYHKHMPNIVITDILMPKLTGLELMQEFRKVDDDLPIIILSAHSDSDKLLKAIDLGVTKYFIKPVDPDELLEYISLLIPKIKKKKIIKLKDDFNFNIQKKELYLNASSINLTKREINLITFLLEQEEYMANNITIKELLWNEEVSDERLRTFIRRLRAKTSKNLIINSSGLGYGIAT